MNTSQNKLEKPETSNICIRVPIFVKAKLKKAAKQNHRDMTKQILFFIDKGVKHLESGNHRE